MSPPLVARFRPHVSIVILGLAAILAMGIVACGRRGPQPGTVHDEAMRAGLKPNISSRDDGLLP